MRRRLAVLAFASLSVACGGSENTYRVPASSPMQPFEAPDPDDLVDEEAETDDGDEAAEPAATEPSTAAEALPAPVAVPAAEPKAAAPKKPASKQ